jgi:selT/selW/selH-like putative selenoprotein
MERERLAAAPVTRERFEQGLTYDDYKAGMIRNRERFIANEETLDLSDDDLEFFRRLPRPLNVLVLAEDWCGDVINNLPVLGGLAAASRKLNLRVFPRDEHPDIMDLYLHNGEFRSIPVFVFFDDEFKELGYWIERPARVREAMDRLRADLFANDPLLSAIPPDTAFSQLPEDARLRLGQAFGAFREENRVFSDREVVREIRELLARALNIAVAAQPDTASPSLPAETPAPRPVKVSITYCAECGYEPQTLAITSALMEAFRGDLASIELIPWHDGAFDVVIDGELVHSMYRDGGFPEHERIIQAVRERRLI